MLRLFTFDAFYLLRQAMKVIVLFILCGFIVYPLLRLVFAASPEWVAPGTLFDDQTLRATLHSLVLALASILGSVCIGTYLAYTLHYKKIVMGKILSNIVLLPIAMPPIIGTISYLFLLDDNGLIVRVFEIKNFEFSGWTAILIVHFYSFYPLFYLFVGNAIKALDISLIEAAYALGSSKTKVFFDIILPQLKSAIVSASLLVFMASMASFSAPYIYGRSLTFLTTEIYFAKVNGDGTHAAWLSLLLLAISFTTFLMFKIYTRNQVAPGKSKGTAKHNNLSVYRRYSYGSSFVIFLFCIAVSLPIVSLFVISIVPEPYFMKSSFDFDFSLGNYVQMFMDFDVLFPILNSFQYAVMTIAVTGLLGLTVGLMIRGKQTLFKSALEFFFSIPYGVPGTVLAICLIYSFNTPTIFLFGYTLIGTVWILPVAYSIRNIPILIQAVKTGLHSIDTSIEEAARSLGSGHVATFFSITFPLIFSFVIEGGMLIFINSLGEFVSTVLLYTYESKTISVEIYSQLRMFSNGMAATYGVMLFLLVIITVFLVRGMTNSSLKVSD